MQYVYLLKCSDRTTYTGCTNNIEERLKRHHKGEVLYTSTRLPLELITYIAFSDKYQAFHFEKYLKSGSGKAFLINLFFSCCVSDFFAGIEVLTCNIDITMCIAKEGVRLKFVTLPGKEPLPFSVRSSPPG